MNSEWWRNHCLNPHETVPSSSRAGQEDFRSEKLCACIHHRVSPLRFAATLGNNFRWATPLSLSHMIGSWNAGEDLALTLKAIDASLVYRKERYQ